MMLKKWWFTLIWITFIRAGKSKTHCRTASF
jgi:hypothetical protein